MAKCQERGIVHIKDVFHAADGGSKSPKGPVTVNGVHINEEYTPTKTSSNVFFASKDDGYYMSPVSSNPASPKRTAPPPPTSPPPAPPGGASKSRSPGGIPPAPTHRSSNFTNPRKPKSPRVASEAPKFPPPPPPSSPPPPPPPSFSPPPPPCGAPPPPPSFPPPPPPIKSPGFPPPPPPVASPTSPKTPSTPTSQYSSPPTSPFVDPVAPPRYKKNNNRHSTANNGNIHSHIEKKRQSNYHTSHHNMQTKQQSAGTPANLTDSQMDGQAHSGPPLSPTINQNQYDTSQGTDIPVRPASPEYMRTITRYSVDDVSKIDDDHRGSGIFKEIETNNKNINFVPRDTDGLSSINGASTTSSGYQSDIDFTSASPTNRNHQVAVSPSYDTVIEGDFGEDECTLDFGDEDEGIGSDSSSPVKHSQVASPGRHSVIYKEYEGEDFSKFLRDEGEPKYNQRNSASTLPNKNKQKQPKPVQNGYATNDREYKKSGHHGHNHGLKDKITQMFTLNRNGKKDGKQKIASIHNFSYADSKLGSYDDDDLFAPTTVWDSSKSDIGSPTTNYTHWWSKGTLSARSMGGSQSDIFAGVNSKKHKSRSQPELNNIDDFGTTKSGKTKKKLKLFKFGQKKKKQGPPSVSDFGSYKPAEQTVTDVRL